MKKICLPVEDINKYPNYVNALKHLNVQAMLIDKVSDPSNFDGLLLPGGADINPSYYHQKINGSEDINKELDDLQYTMLDLFVKAKKPVFGICRGHQLINIYFQGNLFQDIKESKQHKRQGEIDNINEISCETGSFLYPIYGQRFTVNSSHHQAADIVGKDLEIAARSSDGIIEALQHKTLPIWSVQFHPERMCFEKTNPKTVDGSKVLQFFIDQC